VSETIRAFIAVDLPEEIKSALSSIQDRLRTRLAREGLDRVARWARPEGIHLTLKFLGETPAVIAPELGQTLEVALAGVGAPRLTLQGLGVFPNARAPRVIWVGLGGDLEALAALNRRVEAAIAPLGFPTEVRPFSPHLTLARIAEHTGRDERERIGAAVQRATLETTAAFAARTVSLIRSDLLPGGPLYTPLHSVQLGRPHQTSEQARLV